MTDSHEAPTRQFPVKFLLAGFLFALVYLPTLAAPFDFLDDGNLVYPTPGLTARGHAELWWDKVADNVRHLGPFRPVVWAHWQVQANVFGADPVAWRTARLLWCGLAGAMLLGLLRELRIAPIAAFIATAAAMWNPYRNEIWTSLTLAEGVAMPYALGALWAARRAAVTQNSWRYDLLAIGGLLLALGCKNIFVALVPAMLAFRSWPVNRTWFASVKWNWISISAYALPVVLPLVHLWYFRTHWHPGQYETPGPSWAQAQQIALWMKGAGGLDYLGGGLVLALGAVLLQRTGCKPMPPNTECTAGHRSSPAIAGAILLAGCGFLVYLPLTIMCGRYTMPAVWGLDIAFAVLLGHFAHLPNAVLPRLGWTGIAIGLAALVVASIGRQEKLATRSRMLWDVVYHLEENAPRGARVAWVSGESEQGELNAEEGIHVYWHLLHRGRGDVRLALYDRLDEPLKRVELAPPLGDPEFRIAAKPKECSPDWTVDRRFQYPFRFGRRKYECGIESRRPAEGSNGLIVDPLTANWLQTGFEHPDADAIALRKLLPKSEPGTNPTAGLLEKSANAPR